MECALLLRRSGLGLLKGKFRQFLTVICPPHDSGGVYRLTFIFLYFQYGSLQRDGEQFLLEPVEGRQHRIRRDVGFDGMFE